MRPAVADATADRAVDGDGFFGILAGRTPPAAAGNPVIASDAARAVREIERATDPPAYGPPLTRRVYEALHVNFPAVPGYSRAVEFTEDRRVKVTYLEITPGGG